MIDVIEDGKIKKKVIPVTGLDVIRIKGKTLYYELTEEAWKWLRRHNVESFYDLPSAKTKEWVLMNRKWKPRRFHRFEGLNV